MTAMDSPTGGIIAGAGLSTFYDNNYSDSKLYGNIGLAFNFFLKDKWTLFTSGGLAAKGFSDKPYNPDIRIKLQYIDLSALVRYTPANSFYFSGGIYSAFLIKYDYRYLAYSKDYYGEPDISNIVNKLDYGLKGGLGFQFSSGMGIEYQMSFGLRDVFNSGSSQELIGYQNKPYFIPEEAKGKLATYGINLFWLF